MAALDDATARVGAAVALVFVVLLVVGAVQGVGDTATPPTPDAAESLVDAFAHTRTMTHRSQGTFRREGAGGAELESATEVVQRPPDRLVRGFDEVAGRRDDRVLSCPAPVAGEETGCVLGPPGPDFDDVVAEEVATFASLVTGDDPLYEVRRRADGCFVITRTRYDPRSGYGVEAELCFDGPDRALSSVAIDHGTVQETTVYDDITLDVADADLEP